MTAQGHPRAIFSRAIENGNLVVAEQVAREVPNLTLEEALRLLFLHAEGPSQVREGGAPLALDVRPQREGRDAPEGADRRFRTRGVTGRGASTCGEAAERVGAEVADYRSRFTVNRIR
jgi:hypothetical protein